MIFFFRIIVKEIVAENNPADGSQTVSLKAPAKFPVARSQEAVIC